MFVRWTDMPMIRKALADITKEHLEELLAAGWFEDEQLDFKSSIPHKDGEGRDPWRNSATPEARRIKEHGRDQLLATLVAFANSYGGDLVIGVREVSCSQPGKAEGFDPLPFCDDAAHRLSQMANECIEPPLANLQVSAVKISGEGDGVVLLRISRSRLAPHRLTTTKDSYHRVRHETRAMTMRQIQDLTFSVARGIDFIDRRFAELRESFTKWTGGPVPAGKKRMAIRMIAVPVDQSLYVEHVHGVHEIRPGDRNIRIKFSPQSVLDCSFPYSAHSWRPGLRCSEGGDQSADSRCRTTVFCDGAIRYEVLYDVIDNEVTPGQHGTHLLYPEWFFAIVANVVESCDRFRTYAGLSAVEYVLHIELFVSAPLPVSRTGTSLFFMSAGTIPAGQFDFPRYVVGSTEQRNALYLTIWRDFWNAVGVDAKEDDFVIEAPLRR